MRKQVLCILGPTASGKTQLACDLSDYLSKNIGCDLISVDSAMIYKHMNIGTAKPSEAQRSNSKDTAKPASDKRDTNKGTAASPGRKKQVYRNPKKTSANTLKLKK